MFVYQAPFQASDAQLETLPLIEQTCVNTYGPGLLFIDLIHSGSCCAGEQQEGQEADGGRRLRVEGGPAQVSADNKSVFSHGRCQDVMPMAEPEQKED